MRQTIIHSRLAMRASCSKRLSRARHFQKSLSAFIAIPHVVRMTRSTKPGGFGLSGLRGEFSDDAFALFRRSPGEGANHGVQALDLRIADSGRPVRRVRSLVEKSAHQYRSGAT